MDNKLQNFTKLIMRRCLKNRGRFYLRVGRIIIFAISPSPFLMLLPTGGLPFTPATEIHLVNAELPVEQDFSVYIVYRKYTQKSYKCVARGKMRRWIF